MVIMSRTSLLLGVVVAIVIHVALFWPIGKQTPAKQPRPLPRLTLERPETPDQQTPDPPVREEARVPETERELEREPELAEVVDQPPTEGTPVTPPAPMEQTREARRAEEDRETLGDSPAREPDDDALPPVRIVWDGPDEVRSVARELGMRIVAVDRRGDVLGEVSRTGSANVVPFDSGTSRFSNRVRMIDDRGFFGESIPRELEGRLSAFWLLVPAELDRALSDEIRRTIRESGYTTSQVRFVEASFEERSGRRVLKIGRIETGAGL